MNFSIRNAIHEVHKQWVNWNLRSFGVNLHTILFA